MLKKLGFATLLFTSQLWIDAHAVTNSLPVGCEYGRDKSYNVSSDDLAAAVQNGLSVSDNPYDASSWVKFVAALSDVLDSFDYLRIEGANHVLQGQNSRFKGNLFDIYANVNFNTSESGFVGQDKSNLDANAYKDVKFDRTYGYGLVWITRGGLCSAKGVWVQKPPTVTPISLISSGSQLIAEFAYKADKYSKAAKDTATDTSIQISWIADGGGLGTSTVYRFAANEGTFRSFEFPEYGGDYTVYATISDGTFSTRVSLGRVSVDGAPWRPCPTCEIP